MNCLYVTADKINEPNTGGGQVTGKELSFLWTLGKVDTINPLGGGVPFETDTRALIDYKNKKKKYDLAHFYAGTFSALIKALKEDGTKVCYTCAAHDIDVSAEEHQKLGIPFDYPHLVQPELRERYLQGYRDADLVICPSSYSKGVCERYGCKNVTVVPHGIQTTPLEQKPYPQQQFVVGYLGSLGCDKGLIYLIKAWQLLNLPNAILKIAGRNSESLLPIIREHGGGKVHLAGFVKNTADFYNSCSIYVQPSATEGFGIEIVEAMAHGRPVISSTNNAGPDVIQDGVNGKVVAARSISAMSDAIDYYHKHPSFIAEHGAKARERAKEYQWYRIKDQYLAAWRTL